MPHLAASPGELLPRPLIDERRLLLRPADDLLGLIGRLDLDLLGLGQRLGPQGCGLVGFGRQVLTRGPLQRSGLGEHRLDGRVGFLLGLTEFAEDAVALLGGLPEDAGRLILGGRGA